MPLVTLFRAFHFAKICIPLFSVLALAQNPVPFVNQPLAPDAAAPGGPSFTLTVNGTGFVSGATIDWNGAALTTAFVSSSQLTATVPASDIATAGTANVTVANPNGATSQYVIFEITNPVSAVGFARTDLNGPMQPCSPFFVVTADFNGDGNLDLLQCAGNQITVLLGNGDGTFRSLAPITLQGGGTFLAGDVNNDGKIDLVEVNNLLTVLLGNGDGTFQAPIVSQNPKKQDGQPALGDFNGDGRLDLAVPFPCSGNICDTAGYVLIYLGNGDGTFQNAIDYDNFPNFVMPDSIVLGDFNQDKKLDLAVGSSLGTYLMLGNGDGSFQDPAQVTAAGAVAAADLNGDGKLDLIAPTAFNSDAVSVYLGNGDGTFGPGVNFAAAITPQSIVPYDVNGDGELDLLVTAYDSEGTGDGSLSILLGNGDGTFQTPTNFVISTTFAPLAVGDFNKDGRLDLVVSDDDAGSIFLQTTVSLPTAPINFGNQDVNTTSSPLPITLTNLASTTLQISSIRIVGANQGDFVIQSNNCGSSLPAGQSCVVSVTFTPTAKGARSASLQFTDSAPASPQAVTLLGTGIGTNPPNVSLSPTSLTFPDQAVGITSSPMKITVTNTGDLTLTFSGVVFEGADPGDFSQTNDCTSVGGGFTCTINVTFTPRAEGARSATLTLFDNATNSPQTAPVSGTGVPPGLGLMVPPGSANSATVAAGQSANYNLSLGGEGMSGTATLTCTGAPTGASCSLPGSINISATQASPFMVTVTTTASGSAALPGKSSLSWAWALFLLGVIAVPGEAGIRRLRKKLIMILPLLLIVMLTSCGGGGGGGSSSGSATPAGTYNLTVTATMGSMKQSQTLRLIVL